MAVEDINFYTDETPEEYFLKTREERTDFTEGRRTDFEEELQALRNSYEALPGYFPEPYFAVEDSEGLAAIGMEQLELDTKLEYATMEGYTQEEASGIYDEAVEVVETLHENPDLTPHGDLIGNVWISDERPVFVDPRGIPESFEEEQEWIQDDKWQMEWIKDSVKK